MWALYVYKHDIEDTSFQVWNWELTNTSAELQQASGSIPYVVQSGANSL